MLQNSCTQLTQVCSPAADIFIFMNPGGSTYTTTIIKSDFGHLVSLRANWHDVDC